MKKYVLFLLTILFLSNLFSQTAIQPSGNGSIENPFLIGSLSNLYWISQNPIHWDKNYLQTCDIDADDSRNWFTGEGWLPIGDSLNKFSGQFDGANHSIENLYIDRSGSDNQALFAFTKNATIKQLSIKGAFVRGHEYISTLVAKADSCIIEKVEAQGIIVGYSNTGGVISLLDHSDISKSSFQGTIYCQMEISGGLIAKSLNSNIIESFSYISLLDCQFVSGGLVGYSIYSKIQNCYSRGYNHCPNYTAGLIGKIINQTIVINSYSAVKLIGQEYLRGFSNNMSSNNVFNNVFWDYEVSGLSENTSIPQGIPTSDMSNQNTYLNAGWDFTNESANGTADVWIFDTSQNDSYPYLAFQSHPLLVTNPSITTTNNSVALSSDFIIHPNDAIIEHGYCWDTEENPNLLMSSSVNLGNLISNNHFESNISNLQANTLYYAKSYFITANDTVYSGTISFCTDPIIAISLEGEGIESNPYQVNNQNNLIWICKNTESWNKAFVQTADINLIASNSWYPNIYLFNYGFNPIGNYENRFDGKYNGQFHKINNLYINSPNKSYIGLFGFTYHAMCYPNTENNFLNLDLRNVNIKGRNNVGGILGKAEKADISNCSVQGEISGCERVGGLSGIIIDCITKNISVNANINGYSEIGGITGNYYNFQFDPYCIMNAYSQGIITGHNSVGGLIGMVNGLCISNCYSIMQVVCADSTSYGPLFGYSVVYIDANSGFWNTDLYPGGDFYGIGINTSEMQDINTFTAFNWDFENTWNINPEINNGFPYLLWEDFSVGSETPEQTYSVSKICSIYPNPFNPETNIAYEVSKNSKINIDIFNIKGQKVKCLLNQIQTKGTYSIKWDGQDNYGKKSSTGVYFVRLQSSDNAQIKKILMLK